MDYVVRLSESLHTRLIEEQSKVKCCAEIGLIGRNKRGVFVDYEPMPRGDRNGGCHNTPSAEAEEMVRASLVLIRKGLVPAGLVRLSTDNTDYHAWGYDDGYLPWDIKGTIVITFYKNRVFASVCETEFDSAEDHFDDEDECPGYDWYTNQLTHLDISIVHDDPNQLSLPFRRARVSRHQAGNSQPTTAMKGATYRGNETQAEQEGDENHIGIPGEVRSPDRSLAGV